MTVQWRNEKICLSTKIFLLEVIKIREFAFCRLFTAIVQNKQNFVTFDHRFHGVSNAK